MRRFTDSPYEEMMQEVPRPGKPGPMAKPPADSPCHGCGYWRGMPCVGNCWRELLAPRKAAGSCGHFVHNRHPENVKRDRLVEGVPGCNSRPA